MSSWRRFDLQNLGGCLLVVRPVSVRVILNPRRASFQGPQRLHLPQDLPVDFLHLPGSELFIIHINVYYSSKIMIRYLAKKTFCIIPLSCINRERGWGSPSTPLNRGEPRPIVGIPAHEFWAFCLFAMSSGSSEFLPNSEPGFEHSAPPICWIFPCRRSKTIGDRGISLWFPECLTAMLKAIRSLFSPKKP